MSDCPNLKGQERGGKDQASCSSDATNKNRFYAPRSRGEKETSPDVMIGMLNFFYLDVCALLDLGAMLSFVTALVAKKSLIFYKIFCMNLF